MAVVRILQENRTLHEEQLIRAELSSFGVEYERWELSRVAEDGSDASARSAEQVMAAYAVEIDEMKRLGGYTTADVIDITPETPDLDKMLARFDKEHTHSEDEVRFVLAGRGIFFLRAQADDAADNGENVISVEVGPGDMLRVPKATAHWFTLCQDRRIRAIRWFQDTTGWTSAYMGSGADEGYQPLSFGPAYLGSRVETNFSL